MESGVRCELDEVTLYILARQPTFDPKKIRVQSPTPSPGVRSACPAPFRPPARPPIQSNRRRCLAASASILFPSSSSTLITPRVPYLSSSDHSSVFASDPIDRLHRVDRINLGIIRPSDARKLPDLWARSRHLIGQRSQIANTGSSRLSQSHLDMTNTRGWRMRTMVPSRCSRESENENVVQPKSLWTSGDVVPSQSGPSDAPDDHPGCNIPAQSTLSHGSTHPSSRIALFILNVIYSPPTRLPRSQQQEFDSDHPRCRHQSRTSLMTICRNKSNSALS